MIREIVLYGHPALRAKGEAVRIIDDALRDLVTDLLDSMDAAHGVGLASQQIGVAKQVAVVDVSPVTDRPSRMWIDGEEVDPLDHMPLVLVNPKVQALADPVAESEGCLSFPDLTEDILRPETIRVKTHRLDGTLLEFEAGGLLARAVQHEVDHLNGILFIDRMNSVVKAGLSGQLKRMRRRT